MNNVMNRPAVQSDFMGLCGDCGRFLTEKQLSDRTFWKKFVDQFRERIDGTNDGWRGEYWGKMMRGGVLVYEFTRDEALYAVLTETVEDMLTTADETGRVSSFSDETVFRAWDLWCRKYVLLGLEYYLEICKDQSLRSRILCFLAAAADDILAHIGRGEGKIHINVATQHWLGLNSSSILEPMVRLYNLTGEQRFFDFAKYIVDSGFTEGYQIIERAYENILKPYQYGVVKAYEMMSCFEGLLEFYYITGIEKYKTAVINFAKAVMETEVSVIGSCGCTHELFDHTKNRQTQFYDGIMQETCVTVTWMKFCSRLLLLTGESCFADAMEHSFYNAYLGSLNPYDLDSDAIRAQLSSLQRTSLAFDSYSPLIPGKRGRATGGFQILSDRSYYGCCVCIGAAGVGVFANTAVLEQGKDLVVNFYEKGVYTLADGTVIRVDTAYPANGTIRLTVDAKSERILKLRIPAWCEHANLPSENGYASVRLVQGINQIELVLDMSLRETLPVTWELDALYTDTTTCIMPPVCVKHRPEDDDYISLSYGPLTLAADSRLGKAAGSAYTFARKDGRIDYRVTDETSFAEHEPCTIKLCFTDESGENFTLIDYASAGKDWQTDIAAWLPTK